MGSSLSPHIFDRTLVRLHQKRASNHFSNYRFLYDEVETQIKERLCDVKRRFTTFVDLSPVPMDLDLKSDFGLTRKTVLFDEEFLPFGAKSFDLITSNLSLHWVNDVPGVLYQIHNALKEEGLFIGTLTGEQTLHELRACLLDAELAVTGGISPRMSPTIDLQTASTLMQRAGFSLPVVDKETVTLIYPDLFTLMKDLRYTGQTNALIDRPRHFSRRQLFLEAGRLYQERFGNSERHIPATFDIIYLHGWK